MQNFQLGDYRGSRDTLNEAMQMQYAPLTGVMSAAQAFGQAGMSGANALKRQKMQDTLSRQLESQKEQFEMGKFLADAANKKAEYEYLGQNQRDIEASREKSASELQDKQNASAEERARTEGKARIDAQTAANKSATERFKEENEYKLNEADKLNAARIAEAIADYNKIMEDIPDNDEDGLKAGFADIVKELTNINSSNDRNRRSAVVSNGYKLNPSVYAELLKTRNKQKRQSQAVRASREENPDPYAPIEGIN